jgi:hypothetical protein
VGNSPAEDFSGGQAGEEVFRPWRSEARYRVLLVTLSTVLVVVWYVESNPILESQIALGFDPDEVVRCVLVALAGVTLILTFSAIRARRSLLAAGELRFVGSSLTVSTGSSPVTREINELQQIRCYLSGACVRMGFRDGTITLPGQWLPPGWRPTRKGWLTPSAALIKPSRETHPLLATLRDRRPDLTPKSSRLGLAGIVGAELLMGFLLVFVAGIGNYPLDMENRRTVGRHRADDAALKAFQEGRYLEACDDYRRALPGLRHVLYASVSAADFLLYCGDRKSALKAAVGYDLQPLWPVAMDPEVLARIRMSSGSYDKAEQLLRGGTSLLLYETLAELGRQPEAEEILERLAPKKGMANVLLLRHRNRPAEAREAAGVLCAASNRHAPWAPSGLVRIFELCMLSRGTLGLAEDPRFEPACRAFPELRAELLRFTRREAPELEGELRSMLPGSLGGAAR